MHPLTREYHLLSLPSLITVKMFDKEVPNVYELYSLQLVITLGSPYTNDTKIEWRSENFTH